MCTEMPIRIYVGCLILGVNTLYRVFCYFKLFIIGGKNAMVTTLESGYCNLEFDHSRLLNLRTHISMWKHRDRGPLKWSSKVVARRV